MNTEVERAGFSCELASSFRIRPMFYFSNNPAFRHYVAAAQEMIDQIIPESFWLKLGGGLHEDTTRNCLNHLSRQMPFVEFNTFSDQSGNGGIIRILCSSEFTQGAQRYISDTFSRWLVPGKQFPSLGSFSIDFTFELYPEKRYFYHQDVLQFSHPSDLSIALENAPRLIAETRTNILAVHHARYIASMKTLSQEQRNLMIQENISSLFLSPRSNEDRSAYDQIHQFMLKMTEEEKINQIKKNIVGLLHSRPKNFDRDIFYEMNSFPAYFSNPFAANRDTLLISRVIAYHYLFKKSLLSAVQQFPNERHLSLKLVKSQTSPSNPILGILIGMNLLKETERFERKHLINAIQVCLPNVIHSAESSIVDRREEKLRIFYLEIQKPFRAPFTLAEIRTLQQELPSLLKRQVENVIHPIFMPRNEEEVLRNIVLLSKQIKYLRDIPHLTIHYEKQSDSEISFLIVLVRLLRESDLPFKDLVKNTTTGLRIVIDEVRSAGSLKRRFPKEAVILRTILEKSPFFRKDYSLDLKRARQKVCSEMRLLLGEFRDYNGGMIRKQDEALEQLRKLLGPSIGENEVLLENFFYSLRPGIMQTVLSSETIKHLFEMLLKTLDEDIASKRFILNVAIDGKYFFATIAAVAPTFRDEVQTSVSKLKIASYDVTTFFLHVQEFATMGFVYRTDEIEKHSQFQQTLLDGMLKWKANVFRQ